MAQQRDINRDIGSNRYVTRVQVALKRRNASANPEVFVYLSAVK